MHAPKIVTGDRFLLRTVATYIMAVTCHYGMWDLVTRIETESLEKLDKIVTDIRKLPEIEQTNTFIGA